jgi:hypothetical protein
MAPPTPVATCKHMNFAASVNVHRLTKTEDADEAHRYQADVRIQCAECGLPFRFIGLPRSGWT